MKIKNINRTSQTTCVCGSWLDHWKKFSGQPVTHCPASRCLNEDLVGAHVQKGGDSKDPEWYIYPLCTDHSSYLGELEVSDSYMLISANKKETCER
ncbi:hypothetical protein JW935_25500 [candidate division KSB1 bacterium]|nr:hypothetical protein [candidate division KSB1 bacterium]